MGHNIYGLAFDQLKDCLQEQTFTLIPTYPSKSKQEAMERKSASRKLVHACICLMPDNAKLVTKGSEDLPCRDGLG